MAAASGMRIFFSATPLLLLLMPFFVFGLIAAFQVRYTSLSDAIIFVSITIYLLIGRGSRARRSPVRSRDWLAFRAACQRDPGL